MKVFSNFIAILLLVAILAAAVIVGTPIVQGNALHVLPNESLEPDFARYSLLVVEEQRPSILLPGEPILFRYDGTVAGGYITQNFMERQQLIVHRSDFAQQSVAVPYDQLVGHIASAIPLSDQVIALWGNFYGKVILIAALAFLIFLLLLPAFTGKKKRPTKAPKPPIILVETPPVVPIDQQIPEPVQGPVYTQEAYQMPVEQRPRGPEPVSQGPAYEQSSTREALQAPQLAPVERSASTPATPVAYQESELFRSLFGDIAVEQPEPLVRSDKELPAQAQSTPAQDGNPFDNVPPFQP